MLLPSGTHDYIAELVNLTNLFHSTHILWTSWTHGDCLLLLKMIQFQSMATNLLFKIVLTWSTLEFKQLQSCFVDLVHQEDTNESSMLDTYSNLTDRANEISPTTQLSFINWAPCPAFPLMQKFCTPFHLWPVQKLSFSRKEEGQPMHTNFFCRGESLENLWNTIFLPTHRWKIWDSPNLLQV